MRSASFSLLALAGAAGSLAQSTSSMMSGLSLSTNCSLALTSLLSDTNFTTCLPILDLLPAFIADAPLIPALDMFMTDLCYNAPVCSNSTLMTATLNLAQGCATELAAIEMGIESSLYPGAGMNMSIPALMNSTQGLPMGSNTTAPGMGMGMGMGNASSLVMGVIEAYPVLRETLCLKTSDPYSVNGTAGFLGPAPIPITSYNSTNGTFCVTSLLTQLSAYFGANLTTSYIEGITNATNTTADMLYESISSTILCNECIFGAVDIIEEAYPALGMVPFTAISGVFGASPSYYSNYTFNEALNHTCAYEDLAVSMNGTLPANLTVSIVNSTYPYNITTTPMTMSMLKRLIGF